MIFTLGSSRRAASQSVETSGSSVDDVMDANLPASPLILIAGLDPEIHLLKAWTRGSLARRRRFAPLPACDGLQPFGFFGSTFSTGPPASRQAANPPPICATGFSPMSCAVFAASAERIPPAQ